jgi:hypothetical protein
MSDPCDQDWPPIGSHEWHIAQGCCGGDDQAKTDRMMADMDRLAAWIHERYIAPVTGAGSSPA